MPVEDGGPFELLEYIDPPLDFDEPPGTRNPQSRDDGSHASRATLECAYASGGLERPVHYVSHAQLIL